MAAFLENFSGKLSVRSQIPGIFCGELIFALETVPQKAGRAGWVWGTVVDAPG